MIDALYISSGFTLYIKRKLAKKPEQMEFLLKHERRKLAERNCLEQVRLGELKYATKMNRDRIDKLIEAAANIFCQCALEAKIKELMTPAELKRHEQKAGELKDTQQFVNDMEREAMSTAVTKGMWTGNGSQKPSGDKD